MLIIGHRGARGLAPENTLAALAKGLEHGADMLEFDVRVTKDSKPILHHDSSLQSHDGHKYKIQSHTFAELKDLKPDLASLADVFVKTPIETRLYIEIKPHEDVQPIIKLLRAQLDTSWSSDHLLLASKSQQILKTIHAALPDLPLIVIEPWSGIRATYRARQLQTSRLAMDRRWLWSGFIKAMERSGYQLYAYTLNDPKKARHWRKYGLTGVVTDYPDRYEQTR